MLVKLLSSKVTKREDHNLRILLVYLLCLVGRSDGDVCTCAEKFLMGGLGVEGRELLKAVSKKGGNYLPTRMSGLMLGVQLLICLFQDTCPTTATGLVDAADGGAAARICSGTG